MRETGSRVLFGDFNRNCDKQRKRVFRETITFRQYSMLFRRHTSDFIEQILTWSFVFRLLKEYEIIINIFIPNNFFINNFF